MSERRGDDDQAMDLTTLAGDDALLDALGRGGAAPEGDDLATLLAAWRADLADDSATEVRPATPAVEDADGRPRRTVRRARPWVLRLAAAAVVLVAVISGLGFGSRSAGPDSPLWSLTRLLYPQQAEVRGVQDGIDRARTALREGRFDDAERLVLQARRDLAAIDDPATADRLRVAIDMLARELAAARDATAPPTTAPAGAATIDPGPTAAPSPTIPGTPRPRPPMSGTPREPDRSPSAATPPRVPLPEVPLPTGPLLSPLPSAPPLPSVSLPTGGLLD